MAPALTAEQAGETVSGLHPGRLPDRASVWRNGAGSSHLPQARPHDGLRRDRDERAGQRLGVYGAPTDWRAHMNLPRRRFLQPAAGATALPAVSRLAKAETYPSRPVRIIVGFAPGGSTDIVARLIGQWLSEQLGQSFVIENRPGAAGNVAAEAVVNASPDGY